MTKAAIYTRSSTGDNDRQRDELLAKFGGTHEIAAEYRDDASGNLGVGDRPGLTKMLEDAAKGEFDVLFAPTSPGSPAVSRRRSSRRSGTPGCGW
jgi:DNA invertase Pin-like site-specific DNA recombinase